MIFCAIRSVKRRIKNSLHETVNNDLQQQNVENIKVVGKCTFKKMNHFFSMLPFSFAFISEAGSVFNPKPNDLDKQWICR